MDRCNYIGFHSSKIDENVTSVQRWELDPVLDEFSEVLDDIPRQTDITAHHINTDNSLPVHKAPHKIPHTHKETVKNEFDLMLSSYSGIIEPASEG